MSNLKVANNINVMGVYVLETIDTGKILYIGSSKECNDAKDRHLHMLKTGRYKKNKYPLWEAYQNNNLQIRVVFTCYTEEELDVLEQQIIDCFLGKTTNVQTSVKRHSSNKDENSTVKRHYSNLYSNNPNCKYDEKIIAEIIWCKMNGYKPRQIIIHYPEISSTYIPQIGVYKWVDLEPLKPDWAV